MAWFKYIFIVWLGTFTLACNSSRHRNDSLANRDSVLINSVLAPVYFPLEHEIIKLNMQNGKASAEIHKNGGQTIHLRFNAADYSELKGVVSSPDSLANIRFSQIITPDGEMDGPFSRNISYKLSQKGDYLLLLHENQMAGDSWDSVCQVSLMLQ